MHFYRKAVFENFNNQTANYIGTGKSWSCALINLYLYAVQLKFGLKISSQKKNNLTLWKKIKFCTTYFRLCHIVNSYKSGNFVSGWTATLRHFFFFNISIANLISVLLKASLLALVKKYPHTSAV